MKTTTINCLAAALIALVLGTSHYLPGAEDHGTDWSQSDELAALQATEAGTAKRQAAAQALCTSERGPNSEARWTVDGDLVCTTRRGLVAVQL
ncbi:hypothetical protein [Polaromonas sp.]|uniref:hypothetical protein n=1 Tax=Polaromonas sp. TaxID=1869339 RepID=UPI00326388BE